MLGGFTMMVGRVLMVLGGCRVVARALMCGHVSSPWIGRPREQGNTAT
jgi:hypothetical protein